MDIPYLNDSNEEFVELEIRISCSSFHEEDGYLLKKTNYKYPLKNTPCFL